MQGEQAALTATGRQYALCWFHGLQSIDRFLTSAGVGDRRAILDEFDALLFAKTREAFVRAEEQFLGLEHVKGARGFVKYYKDNWSSCADK